MAGENVRAARVFSAALERAARRIPKEAARFHREIVIDMATTIVIGTPVDTGRARGNWQASVGSPAEGVLEITDRGGGRTLGKIKNALEKLPPYQVVWLSNNVVYIIPLEDGHSAQAPSGMVAVTVARIRTFISRAEARLG